jgi:hypothetical protein
MNFAKSVAAAVVLVSLSTRAADRQVHAVADSYDIKLTLKVPVIVDNMQSLGRRVYRTQRLQGLLVAYYYDETKDPVVVIPYLYNKDYKIRGEYVTYKTYVSGVLWRAVGDNRKGVFKKAAFGLAIEADPSYNIGDDEPDNTLVLTLAGSGSVKSVSGGASGQIGCGCAAYGHKSPTRIVYMPYLGSKYLRRCWTLPSWEKWWYPTVVDIAPCWGTWRLKFRDRMCVESLYDCVAPVDEGD